MLAGARQHELPWIRRHSRKLILLVLITGGALPAVRLFNARLFGLALFTMALPSARQYELTRHQVWLGGLDCQGDEGSLCECMQQLTDGDSLSVDATTADTTGSGARFRGPDWGAGAQVDGCRGHRSDAGVSFLLRLFSFSGRVHWICDRWIFDRWIFCR